MRENEKIKDFYNVFFDLQEIPQENRCPMHDWYNEIINKTYSQLNIFDVTRMLIQKTFLDLAISKALILINQNPFCGQRYEGELIELLSKQDMSYLDKDKIFIKEILLKARVENNNYDWLCEEERKDFEELVNNFLNKIM